MLAKPVFGGSLQIVECEITHDQVLGRKINSGDEGCNEYDHMRLYKVTLSVDTLDGNVADVYEVHIIAESENGACEQATCFLSVKGLRVHSRAERIEFGIRGWSNSKF